MSLILGKGMIVTIIETDLTCPICTAVFDASKMMDRAKYPCFNTKCPKCSGKITIQEPMYSGNVKVWETNPPLIKNPEILQTETEFKINGKVVRKKLYDDNSDEPDDILL